MTIFCIEGNIGAGKSTLIDKVSNLLTKHNIEHKTYKEPIEEWQSLLSAFYADKSKAFELEMTTLKSHLRMLEDARKQEIAIIERSILSNVNVFGKSLMKYMTEEQKTEYINITSEIPELVDHYIYLDIPVETCLERIKKRGRDGESAITAEYLHELKNRIDDFMKSTKVDKIFAEPITYKEDEVNIAFRCICDTCGYVDFYDDEDDDPEEFNSFW